MAFSLFKPVDYSSVDPVILDGELSVEAGLRMLATFFGYCGFAVAVGGDYFKVTNQDLIGSIVSVCIALAILCYLIRWCFWEYLELWIKEDRLVKVQSFLGLFYLRTDLCSVSEIVQIQFFRTKHIKGKGHYYRWAMEICFSDDSTLKAGPPVRYRYLEREMAKALVLSKRLDVILEGPLSPLSDRHMPSLAAIRSFVHRNDSYIWNILSEVNWNSVLVALSIIFSGFMLVTIF
jgi:hypothetical protein